MSFSTCLESFFCALKINSAAPQLKLCFRITRGVEVDSAGLNNDAVVPLTTEQVEWADTIIVMEKVHRSRLNQKFGKHLASKRIAVLAIPDNYEYMDEELVRLLKQRCQPYLP